MGFITHLLLTLNRVGNSNLSVLLFFLRAWFKIWLTSRMAAEYLQNMRQAVLGDRLLEVIEKPFLNSVGQQVLALKAFVGISQKGQQQFASQTLRAICSGIRC